MNRCDSTARRPRIAPDGLDDGRRRHEHDDERLDDHDDVDRDVGRRLHARASRPEGHRRATRPPRPRRGWPARRGRGRWRRTRSAGSSRPTGRSWAGPGGSRCPPCRRGHRRAPWRGCRWRRPTCRRPSPRRGSSRPPACGSRSSTGSATTTRPRPPAARARARSAPRTVRAGRAGGPTRAPAARSGRCVRRAGTIRATATSR